MPYLYCPSPCRLTRTLAEEHPSALTPCLARRATSAPRPFFPTDRRYTRVDQDPWRRLRKTYSAQLLQWLLHTFLVPHSRVLSCGGRPRNSGSTPMPFDTARSLDRIGGRS